MPRTPFQSQSRYEGGRRPWNLTAEPVKKARGSPYKYKEKPEEIQACLSCPLPDCDPYHCSLLRSVRRQAREPGVPKDFRIRLDLGDSTAELARRYGVTKRTVNDWKKAVESKNEAAPAGTGTTSKENTSGPVYHCQAGTSRKERK